MNYAKEQISSMKRYAHALRYNLPYEHMDNITTVFNDIELNFPEVKNDAIQTAENEYFKRRLPTVSKYYWQFDSLDKEIWKYSFLVNLNREIAMYERNHGKVAVELSSQFYEFIEQRNNAINQERLFVKDGQALSYINIMDTLENVLEIASVLTPKEVPYLDEAKLGIKGLNLAMKERNGTITNKDRIGAGLDFMFYVIENSVKNEDIKRSIKIGSSIINLCLEFFIGKS